MGSVTMTSLSSRWALVASWPQVTPVSFHIPMPICAGGPEDRTVPSAPRRQKPAPCPPSGRYRASTSDAPGPELSIREAGPAAPPAQGEGGECTPWV